MARSTAPLSLLGRLASELTSPADVWLGVRVLGWALVLPVLKQVLPIRSLAGAVRAYRPRATRDVALEARIVTFARWAARIIRWRDGGNCLERGLLAYRFLGLAGAHPQLVVGLDREQAGDLIGHAWVVLDGRVVGEPSDSLVRYTPVFAFDADGRLVPVPSEPAVRDVERS